MKITVSRAVAKLGVTWGKLTARSRCLPDFIIVGAQKAGTTSLYYHLADHPQILPARFKEIRFFDRHFHQGMDWYRGHFPRRGVGMGRNGSEPVLTGEATPNYLPDPLVPGRIRQALPDVKLIVLLRNPVDRAYSHYQHNLRNGIESLSFERAIDAEPERLGGERERMLPGSSCHGGNLDYFSYLERGHYARQLAQWFEKFPKEQMLLIRSEILFKNGPDAMDGISRFLGIGSFVRRAFRSCNRKRYPKMNDATRIRLLDYFAEHNTGVDGLLNDGHIWK